jgi:translocation and assembly module TamB
VIVALLLIAGNLPPVQRLIERETPVLTGGTVHIAGLHGRFPDALRLDHVELSDSHGVYASADDIVFDWSPIALVTLTAQVDIASIRHLSVLRRPVPAKPAQASSSNGSTKLPVSIDVHELRVARADIAAPVAGPAFAASLQGIAKINNLQDGAADITVTRLDSAGAYHVDGMLHPGAITAHISVREPADGLIAAAGNLHGLGAIAITANLDGPKSAEQVHLDATAGPIRATLTGFLNIPGKNLALDVAANAPAMQPRADIGWQTIELKAHVAGAFTTPDATGHLTISKLQAAGAGLDSLQAELAGNQGSATLHAVLAGLRIPGKKPDLFASAPVDLQARINLAAPDRPAEIHLAHPLLTADATAKTLSPMSGTLHAILPDLAPLAAAAGTDIHGKADLNATATINGALTNLAATGVVAIDGGATPPPGLRGDTRLDIAATMNGNNIELQHAIIDGRTLHLDANGTDTLNNIALNFNAGIPNIAAFAPQAEGHIAATGTITGTPRDFKIAVDISGIAGAPKYGKGPIAVTLNAAGLPSAPSADLAGKFFVVGANATIAASAQTDDNGAIHTVINRADWKSLKIRADTTTPKDGIPSGKLDITAGNLADFSSLTGQELGGRLHAGLVTTETDATVKLDGQNLAVGARHIAGLALTGRATGVQSDPDIAGTLTLDGIDAQQVTGDAKITAQGRAAALQLRANANLQNLQGAPAIIATGVLLNAKLKQATLQTLTGDWKQIAIRLQSPAKIDFGTRIAVDRLRVAANAATIDLAGQFGPTLNFTANLRNVTPDIAKSFAPDVNAAGVLAADAHITGTTAAPNGTVHIHAAGLRDRAGPAASLPPATLASTITLAGATANIDARVDAGPKLHLAASGTAPLSPAGQLALRATGSLDLTLLNPVLQANGRQAKGRAAFDLTATGSVQNPRVGGAITLANADIQDFAQGLHLDKINGRIDATGDTLTFNHFTAGAGPGTIAIAGTFGITAPGIPVDLHITARNARPLASDLLTAVFDADLAVHGQASAIMDATGTVKLRSMDINIPDNLPPSVSVMNVRRPGQRSPKPPTGPAPPPSSVRLGIDVDAPSSIYVRGKGLNAELAGTLHVKGTTAASLVEGGFQLRRGDFSLAGTTLNFTKGDVTFNGTGITNRIDPTLDFEADSYSGNITATLAITGYADAPKITLSSVPDLPQDEVLAHLLFGQSMSQLSPLQIAEIGAALAEISGLAGSGEGPLGAIRKGLGLDRLSVGSGANGTGTSVSAGRYVAKGVYVGTRQSTSGAGGTQVQVQIDLTRRLKLNTTLGTGGGTVQGATPDDDPGSSVGLSYGFEY